jgi:O-antigen ligase
MKSGTETARYDLYALLFGLFLGLAIWKFGNPVILDHKIFPPASLAEVWADAWPTHWSNWVLLPFVLAGGWLALWQKRRSQTAATRWLWLLPLLWFGWQLLSATHTVDAFLTSTTLWQFGGCIACYFIGVLVLGRERALRWLLIGVLAAFAFCLVRAVDQRLFEFPESRRMLVEGERTGWTNFPPEIFLEMKREGTVITTNGVDVANPVILAHVAKNRVMGTLVYPNALASVILLLLPVSLALAFNSTRQLKPPIRGAVIALTCLLGGLGLFWSGSKAGWLVGMALAGIWLFRLKWSARMKWAMLTTVLLIGLAVFALRFHNYFAAGATSVGARFDYWRAAVQTTRDHPLFGTGPGTFQRPYERIKSPESEMARFAHNDYLEQFSDSGIIGGICYVAWIGLALMTVGQRAWRSGGYLQFSLFLGLLGWFAQGLVEFSLFVPALAWTAFTLLGCLLRMSANQFDKGRVTG